MVTIVRNVVEAVLTNTTICWETGAFLTCDVIEVSHYWRENIQAFLDCSNAKTSAHVRGGWGAVSGCERSSLANPRSRWCITSAARANMHVAAAAAGDTDTILSPTLIIIHD